MTNVKACSGLFTRMKNAPKIQPTKAPTTGISAVTAITEPALSPVRAALSRYEIFDSMPIDYSYLVMIFALLIIRLALPSASSFL